MTTQKTPSQHKFPLQARAAALEPAHESTTDSATNSTTADSAIFSVIFSTGERVRRCDIFNDVIYDEELAIDHSAIRVGRLNAGAPVLDSHEQTTLSNIIGVVVKNSVRIEGGMARASIKLYTGPENTATIKKIQAGIIRNVSVGYVVHRFEIVSESKDTSAIPVYRATDWEPYEISLVPIGADSGAGIRSSPRTFPCEITGTACATRRTNVLINDANRNTDPANSTNPNPANQTQTMTDTLNDTTTNDTTTHDTNNNTFNSIKTSMKDANTIPMQETEDDTTADDISTDTSAGDVALSGDATQSDDNQTSSLPTQPRSQQDGIKLERARILEIQKIVRIGKLPDSFSQTLIEKGIGINSARKIVFDKMAQNSSNVGEIQSVRLIRDDRDSRRALVENALLNRHNPSKFQLDSSAREFRGMTLMEIGRDMLERSGVKTYGLSRIGLVDKILGLDNTRDGGGYMGTSDLPHVLSNVANKTLRDAYDAAPQTFKAFSRQVTAPDFKMMSRVQLGDAPSLEKVNESGEFKRGSLSEGKEQYALSTYGKVIPLNRQMLLNDDLAVFSRIPALLGRAAADLESDIVWGIITGNAPMGDGIELFNAKHGNVSTTGATISIQTLGSAREALRKQKGLGGGFINVTAKYLMVPCALETIAQQFMTIGLVHIKSPDVNPFAGTLQVIAEPRLDIASTTAWYLSGDPSQIDTIEYAYLDGNEGVYLDSRVGFNVDGLEFKARLDFAAKAVDWRGLHKNPGSSISNA